MLSRIRDSISFAARYWFHALVALAIGFAALQLVFVAAILFLEVSRASCRDLRDRAHDPAVQAALESWVKQNWTGDQVPVEDVHPSDGIIPGARWLTKQFDGSLLQMGDGAHVRLVSSSPLPSDPIGGMVEAISFAERTRFAVLVRVSGSALTEISSLNSYPVTDRIVVLCDK